MHPPTTTAADPARPDTIPATALHPPLAPHERARIRAAAARAKQLYPAPVARLIERELLTWEEFGYRLDMHGQVAALVHHISTAAEPTPTATAPPGQRSA